jgi:putative intracellular protease/amidase
VGGASTIKLTADLAANTVGTAAICTGMALSVTAGSYYFFRFNVLYQAAVTTTGIKLGLTFPAVTSFAGTVIALNSGAASVVYGRITTSGGLVTGAGTPVANTTYMAEILGSILPSANGTIQVTYGTEVGGSAVTVKQGSNGLLFTL